MRGIPDIQKGEMMKDYTKTNAETIDQWVQDGWEWGKPVSHEVCSRVRQGE